MVVVLTLGLALEEDHRLRLYVKWVLRIIF
jgi:hypothetical protein